MGIKEDILNHDRHEHIKFDEEPHKYYYFPSGDFRKTKEAVEFQGYTNWLKQYQDVFDAEKQAASSNKNPNSEWYGLGEEEILRRWREKGERTRQYGNDIDNAITECVNLGVYNEDFGGYLDKFWETMDQHEIEPVVAQLVIYDEDIQRASAIDVCGVRKDTDEIVIIDVKSFQDGMEWYSYGGKTFNVPLHPLLDSKYNKVSLQTSIYKYWLENKYGFAISDLFVYLINDDQSELIPAVDYTHYIKKLYKWESEDTDPI